jgi:SAM-dependent methyltransferase
MNTAAIQPNFNLIARPYRWLEYLTLGPALQRCRTHYLHALQNQQQALILGDGDGRFLAKLLAANPHLRAEAVDTSRSMLDLLEARCEQATANASKRLQTHHSSALTFTPTQTCDLIASHFFLDCLTQPELDSLVARLTPHLALNALWLVSDFRIPTGPMRLPATLLISGLYFAFRILTGLRTTRLPDHTAPLIRAGFTSVAQHASLFGLLTTELWQLPGASTAQTITAMAISPDKPDPSLPPDPIPEQEPVAPSLDEPDPGVFHHDPGSPAKPPNLPLPHQQKTTAKPESRTIVTVL